MNAYLPTSTAVLARVAGLLAAILAAGFAITLVRQKALARAAGWLLAAASIAAAERLCAAEPAGFRMLAIVAALLLAMKALACIMTRPGDAPQLTLTQWLAFTAGWFGMRPAIFVRLGGPAREGSWTLAAAGAVRLLVGLGLVGLAALVAARETPWLETNIEDALALALLLAGLSLALHFGIFNLVAALWRGAGVDARPLFRAPLLAKSLAEFWGRRWNLGFSEMTAACVHRPLRAIVGERWATAAAFAFSGILHEIAISLPVRAGYGMPAAYFLLHGALVLVERRLERTGRPVWGWGPWSRVWVLAWLALPLPFLFHERFRAEVLWPILGK